MEPIAAVFACNCDLVFVFASGSSRAYYTCKYVAKPVVSIDHQVAIDIAGKAVAHAIARRQQRLPEARGELASALSVLMSAVMHQAGNTVELPATMCWWHVLYGATGVHSRRRIAKIHLPAIAEFLAESQSAIPTIVRNEAEQKPTITQYNTIRTTSSGLQSSNKSRCMEFGAILLRRRNGFASQRSPTML